MKLKVYTLGIRMVNRVILDAIGTPRHVCQARVMVTARNKREAADMVSAYGCGWVSLSDSEFRLAGDPWSLALLEAFPTVPQVYVEPVDTRPGEPVVVVDDAGPRLVARVDQSGRRFDFNPES